MKGLGIKGTIACMRSANGTAQYLLFSVWGIIMGFMFVDMHLEILPVVIWIVTSIIVGVATVWLPKKYIQNALLADTIITLVILVLFAHHSMEDHNTMFLDIRHTAHTVALLVMSAHGFYLANLVNRQRLERKRVLGEE